MIVQKQQKMMGLMNEILQDDYLTLRIISYASEENLETGVCNIHCKLRNAGKTEMSVEGQGVGLIDALFNGMRQALADAYPSLKSIRFSQFSITGLIASTDGGESTSKAEAEATVGIVNSAGKEFIFKAKQPSVSRAGVQATIEAIEYFVNSERTYVRLHEIIKHYRKDGRMDLVEKYTGLMTQVVENTSYSEVVERLRNSM